MGIIHLRLIVQGTFGAVWKDMSEGGHVTAQYYSASLSLSGLAQGSVIKTKILNTSIPSNI